MTSALTITALSDVPVRHGKVRDIYDFEDRLLLVATDRISAFDFVLPTGIPDKGRVLTKISEFWFNKLDVPHHLLSMDPSDVPLPEGTDVEPFEGRSMVVRKTQVVLVECVVRGYLSGSGWKEYQKSGTVCGVELPAGLQESDKLPEPIFTPTTKADEGHDMPMTFAEVESEVGVDLARRLRDLSIDIYQRGAEYARTQGIIIADTKFEFGMDGDELLLIDEVLTPDSSRFWPEEQYEPGHGQPSFDKQFVRDWLLQSDWDRESDPPALPDEIVAKTREKYIEAYERLSQEFFKWK
ncbi:MAG: phosphoribosylaminoimidazolesuccinocarboxamide synthase [Planctomycetaceae bacterium]|nr:phosphoribosylaminoimidazolesuccinocarboxamide synthase [Planctomycetaceae bacterium]